MPETVQDELLAVASLIALYGARLGRPHADTLGGSRHANMKELRFNADGGVWRVTTHSRVSVRDCRASIRCRAAFKR